MTDATDTIVAKITVTPALALYEHEIPKYYQGRVLAYLFRNSVALRMRSNPDMPVRMEMHEYFNMRAYNAVKSALDVAKETDKKINAWNESMLHDPLNSLFMTTSTKMLLYLH